MAELLQRIDEPRQRPAGQRADSPRATRGSATRPRRPGRPGAASQRLLRLAAGRGEQHAGRARRPAPAASASAASAGPQRMALQRLRIVGSNASGAARRARSAGPPAAPPASSAGIGRRRVHALGRIDQHHLAAAARRGALRELDGFAHGVHPDLACSACASCRPARPAPSASGQPSSSSASGISTTQVGMRAASTWAARALAAGAPGRRSLSHSQACASASASSNWPSRDGPCSSQAWPRCGEQLAELRRGARAGAVIASTPRLPRRPASSSRQTASRGWSASMRRKRAGSAAPRAPRSPRPRARRRRGSALEAVRHARAARRCAATSRVEVEPDGQVGLAHRRAACTQRSSVASTARSKPRPPPW